MVSSSLAYLVASFVVCSLAFMLLCLPCLVLSSYLVFCWEIYLHSFGFFTLSI